MRPSDAARFFSPWIVLLLGLGGCGPVQMPAFNQTQTDVQNLNQRVSRLEQRATTPASGNSDQLRNIAVGQAELRAELDSLRVDLQALTGRLADQQQAFEQLRNETNLTQGDLALRLSQLEQGRPTVPPATTTTVTSPPPVVSQPPVAQTATTNSPAVAPTTVAVSTPPSQKEGTADQLYHQALHLVQQEQDFPRSRELFQRFIQQYPSHELAVNAQYWIGETLYGDKKYENAILQFQDVIQLYPDHPKVPAALLKQGLAFYGLGDTRNARIILQKVVNSYPQSPEAEKARQRLTSWQGE
ncbi:MAG: tol-pal system protein YbgF [Desulfuromonadaceae bacterium]|nr:tol-pal system protein YbgF [Desulfuromonadaceae bacterium]